MKKHRTSKTDGATSREHTGPGVRADARRNIESLLTAAMAVFATTGVDAPVRAIAKQAGVGVGTVYRHFPTRADLIAAVIRHEVDACANAATRLAGKHAPAEALTRWLGRYVDLLAAKRGLAAALHSGDPAYDSLPAYFGDRLLPALQTLLDAAAAAGEVRADVQAYDLLRAVAGLCMPSAHGDPENARRMVGILVDGLRYRARPSGRGSS